jgi:hypothetical protein
MKFSVKAIFTTAVLLTGAACKPEISNDNIDAVNSRFGKGESGGKKNLSPKEVESILGQPDRIESTTIELETQKKQVPVTRYYYEQNGKSIELHFFDNKLINRVPHWDAPTPSEPKQP